jgi:hypothetical protein
MLVLLLLLLFVSIVEPGEQLEIIIVEWNPPKESPRLSEVSVFTFNRF